MKLYCYVCTLGGQRLHDMAVIAHFDPEQVRLPLAADMFKSPWPERGLPDPWPMGTPFHEMLHNGHACWGVELEDAMYCRAQGGPHRLLTEHGWIPLTENGLDISHLTQKRRQGQYDELTQEDLEIEWCARVIKRDAAILARDSRGEIPKPNIIEQMSHLRTQGMSNQAIGDIVGKSREWVRQKLIEAGEY